MIDIEEIDQMFDPLQYSDKRMKAWSKVKEAKHKQLDKAVEKYFEATSNHRVVKR